MPDENELSLNVFGQSAAAKGTSAIIILVLVVAVAGAGYLLYERGREERRAVELIAEALAEHSRTMSEDHRAAIKATEALVEVGSSTSKQLKIQNYLFLMDESEKAEIKRKLGRPPELQ